MQRKSVKSPIVANHTSQITNLIKANSPSFGFRKMIMRKSNKSSSIVSPKSQVMKFRKSPNLSPKQPESTNKIQNLSGHYSPELSRNILTSNIDLKFLNSRVNRINTSTLKSPKDAQSNLNQTKSNLRYDSNHHSLKGNDQN